MSELAKRSLVGLVLIALALALAVLGGWPFALFVALAATIMYVEWNRIVRGWGVAWKLFGFLYCLAPALSLLWIRERAEFEGIGLGFDLLVWVFIIVWATDIGAFFAGRAIGAETGAIDQPQQDRRRPGRRGIERGAAVLCVGDGHQLAVSADLAGRAVRGDGASRRPV